MPVEIKQLVIKSKMINDDSENPSLGSDHSSVEPEENLLKAAIAYHLMTSTDEVRER